MNNTVRQGGDAAEISAVASNKILDLNKTIRDLEEKNAVLYYVNQDGSDGPRVP